MRLRTGRWMVLGVVVALCAGLSSAAAQDETRLSAEQQDWVARVFAAHDQFSAYDSYFEDAFGHSHDSIVLYQGAELREISVARVWSRQAATVRTADGESVNAQIKASVRHTDGSTGTWYTVKVAARVVRGILYVRAAYDDTQDVASLPPLAEGWATIDDPTSLLVYEDLPLTDLLDMAVLLDDQPLVLSAAADVTLAADRLPDGTPVDVITITFDRTGVETVLRAFWGQDAERDPVWMDTLLGALTEDSALVMSTTLGEDDRPLVFQSVTLTRALDMDAGILADNLGGQVRIDIIQDSTSEQHFSRVNDPTLRAVEAPPLGP